jgi:hypothetical protein
MARNVSADSLLNRRENTLNLGPPQQGNEQPQPNPLNISTGLQALLNMNKNFDVKRYRDLNGVWRDANGNPIYRDANGRWRYSSNNELTGFGKKYSSIKGKATKDNKPVYQDINGRWHTESGKYAKAPTTGQGKSKPKPTPKVKIVPIPVAVVAKRQVIPAKIVSGRGTAKNVATPRLFVGTGRKIQL